MLFDFERNEDIALTNLKNEPVDSVYAPLPVIVRRLELTRAEILGRIGMIPVKNTTQGDSRFGIKYINSPEFFKQIEQILESDGDTPLSIPLTEEEYNHFDVK